MKRWMKRSIAVACSVLMVIGMTACGREVKKDDGFRTPRTFEKITKKTGLHMDFEIEDEDTKMDFYTKKDSLYMDYDIDGEKAIIISDGKILTALDPATKTGEQAEIDDSVQKSIDQLSASVDKIYDIAGDDDGWTRGTAKYDGMEYESEEVEKDGASTKFLYNDDGKLVYIISEDDDGKAVIKINTFDDKVPDDIFEIPDDYTIGGGDSNPEPQPEPKTGNDTKKPTGNYQKFTDTTHGFQFEVDTAFATKIDGENMNVYTGTEGQLPMFHHFIMQNKSGQTDEQLLSAVGNQIVKDEGSNLVKGPITNKFDAGGRTVKGLEWIVKTSTGRQIVKLEYVEVIQTFFHIWTASYYSGDTVTPAALEHAIKTFEMLAS